MIIFAFILLLISFNVCYSERVPPEVYITAIHKLTSENPDPQHLVDAKKRYVQDFESRSTSKSFQQEDLAYFKIVPKFLGNVPPGETTLFQNKTCFHSIQLSSIILNEREIELRIEHTESDNLLCHRSFVISTGSHVEISELWGNGGTSYTLTSDGSPQQNWDLFERGPRVFVYLMTPEQLTYNLAATASLFEPVLTQGVAETFADMNREFLKEYVGIDMKIRDGFEVLNIPEQLIKNGDTFDIMRLDGLDPVIAYAMGAATGHTAVALWRNESLFICESNAKSAYWPTNGIQCNPYQDWIEYGHQNGYNVVWAPLKQEIKVNVEKAWEFVDHMYGIDYGWEVVVMGWLDTVTENFPCMKDRNVGEICLEPEHLELLFSYLQRVSYDAARVFVPAIQQRASVPFNSTLLQAYHSLALQGIEPTEVFTIPEKDGWKYETSRNNIPELSESMICNVFVCNVWKAAGLFDGSEVNCGETSVNDNYRLNIYQNADERPEICKKSDPKNPNCQILGKYTLRLDAEPGVLPRYNYVPIVSGMFESCPSRAPSYLAPRDC